MCESSQRKGFVGDSSINATLEVYFGIDDSHYRLKLTTKPNKLMLLLIQIDLRHDLLLIHEY